VNLKLRVAGRRDYDLSDLHIDGGGGGDERDIGRRIWSGDLESPSPET